MIHGVSTKQLFLDLYKEINEDKQALPGESLYIAGLVILVGSEVNALTERYSAEGKSKMKTIKE